MAGGVMREGGDGEDDSGEMAEINVTPFIDVMLVLLIIFMVAAPLATVDVKVDLPTSNAPSAPRPDKPTYVTIQPDLTVRVGDLVIPEDQLQSALQASTGGDPEARVFLRADKVVSYGDLMVVMNRLRDLGYPRIALVGLESAAAAGAPGSASAGGSVSGGSVSGGGASGGSAAAAGAAQPTVGGGTASPATSQATTP